MFREAAIAHCLRLAFGGGVAGLVLIGSPTFAQTAPDTDTAQKVESIEITGSSIKRINAETALPVQIITHDDIVKSGAQSTEDLMKLISAADSGGAFTIASAFGQTSSGVSQISLRGLGAQRTLVLIDGRRATVFGGVPGSGGDESVDVNSIPLSQIERIEVLKDGASAIYGSDAIGGVVNFILRKDYVGGEVTIGGGDSEHGGGANNKTSVLLGFGDLTKDHFNVNLNAAYEHDDGLQGSQRPFARQGFNAGTGNSGTSFFSFPANVFTPNGLLNPNFPNCGPSIIDPIAQLQFPGSCQFDPSPSVGLLPIQDKHNLLVNAHFDINPDTEAYANYSFVDNRARFVDPSSPMAEVVSTGAGSPYNAFLANLVATQYPGVIDPLTGQAYNQNMDTFGTATLLLPPSSPYYPTAFAAANGLAGQPLNVFFRSIITGNRVITDQTDANRLVLGLKGLAAGWDYDTAFLYTQSEVKESTGGGYFQYSKFGPLFDSGVINPFGISSPAAQAAAQATNFNAQVFSTKTSLMSLDGHASHDIFSLPSGPVTLAVGGEVRQEKYSEDSATAIQEGDVSGYGGNFLPVSKSRDVEAVFSEAVIPISKNLEGDVAARFDNYENVGNTVNPKVSLRWQPMEQLLVRASAGTGFRAPSLTDLYAPQVQGLTSIVSDPLHCPGGTQCHTQLPVVTGGNRNLKPEKSTQETFGVVWEPSRDVSIGVDAFQIQLRNEIAVGGLDFNKVLASAALATQFSSFINRAPDGSIVSVVGLNSNLFKVNINGVDLDAKWRFLSEGANKLTFELHGTYFNRYDQQNPDGSFTNAINQAATIAAEGIGTGVVTHWKSRSTLTWDTGPWSTTLANNWQSGYHDALSNFFQLPRDVSSYVTWDLNLTYTGFKNVVISTGIDNLLDRDPPYTNIAPINTLQAGYDPTYANPLGRFFYAALTYKFK